MLRVKRNWDTFNAGSSADFGYNAHAGVNVEKYSPSSPSGMDGIEMPAIKRSKYAMHEETEEFRPSTQANLSKTPSHILPKLSSSNDVLNPSKWLRALPRARRHHHELIGTVGVIGKSDSVFSLEDVTQILSAALKEQEDNLHQQYQGIISDRITDIVRDYEREKEVEINSKFQSSDTSYFS